MSSCRTRSATEAGYSLIECLLAAGLLTGVLVSISGLFILGTSSVKSGRELTKATTVANSCMEQVMSMPFESVYGLAGAIGSGQTANWSTNNANPTFTGTSEDVAEWTSIINAWRTTVRSQLMLGELTFKVDGMGRLPAGGDPGLVPYVDAQFLRVIVTVSWSERNGRRRSVTFEEITL